MIPTRVWGLLRGILFRFDAERVHRLSIWTIRVLGRLQSRRVPVIQWISGAPIERSTVDNPNPNAGAIVFGQVFATPVGLAAGFDKDAEILSALPEFGFGFAEIGTVTPRPQVGNSKPRLFRDSVRQSIFNRMGFNGLGAEGVARHLERERSGLPTDFRVGINVGPNKDTPAASVHLDCRAAAQPFRALVDYVVINVSSPNTPGLRSLQTVDALRPIIRELRDMIAGWPRRIPVLVKLAPEITQSGAGSESLEELLLQSEQEGVDGWIVSNTLQGTRRTAGELLRGGWSGGILTEISRSALGRVRAITDRPIISVGGILSPEEAATRLDLGADLIQIYSGWVYGGPRFPAQISSFLAEKTAKKKPRAFARGQ